MRLIGYASGNFGKNLVWSTADITLLFILTDLIGLPVTSAALLMTIAVAGDLIFDLLAGAISAQVKAYGAGYRWLITLCRDTLWHCLHVAVRPTLVGRAPLMDHRISCIGVSCGICRGRCSPLCHDGQHGKR